MRIGLTFHYSLEIIEQYQIPVIPQWIKFNTGNRANDLACLFLHNILLHHYHPLWIFVWDFREQGHKYQVEQEAFCCNRRLPIFHDRLIAANGVAPARVVLKCYWLVEVVNTRDAW